MTTRAKLSSGGEEEYSGSEDEYSEEEERHNSEYYEYTETDDSWSDRGIEEPLEDVPPKAPLVNLVRFVPWSIEHDATLKEVRVIFAHCFNIGELKVPLTHIRNDEDAVARVIANACPRITVLSYFAMGVNPDFDDIIMFKILGHLPAQQVRMITLRSLHLESEITIPSRAFQAILQECRGLEGLYVHSESRLNDFYITLEDAVSGAWVCSRIRHLDIIVGFKELTAGPKGLLYYARESPLVLSAEETEQFVMLEALYRQLGALRDLKYLFIRASTLGTRHRRFENTTLPAMLSLGDPINNRPRHLDLLKGLMKLQILRGSVLLDTKEAKATIDEQEAVWIGEHWLKLREADIFRYSQQIEGPFKQLRRTCRHLGRHVNFNSKRWHLRY
ncbi:hypothetical protein BG015_006234 [Linnemannia schmuckeri]|uniref:Uncharacterized protein n=1 Tax=Linnemannia schmuckeri TaxID=64567 RepID=A0A9P5S0T1_9FUNG|nr:hypothetical protein BG015_006234 [Linnemannia schmuckeri]